MKTPEQLAEEYAYNEYMASEEPVFRRIEDDFLAGYRSRDKEVDELKRERDRYFIANKFMLDSPEEADFLNQINKLQIQVQELNDKDSGYIRIQRTSVRLNFTY